MYYGKSDKHADFAREIKKGFGTRIVDLAAPNSGIEVKRLTGLSKAASPTLILPAPNGQMTASGMFAVSQVIKAASLEESPFSRGRIALISIIFMVGLGCLFADELRPLSGYSVFGCLLGLTSVLGGCLSCHTGSGNSFTALAPVFGLGYAAYGAYLFSLSSPPPRWFYLPFLIVSALIPVMQAGLLVVEPKLCMGCCSSPRLP